MIRFRRLFRDGSSEPSAGSEVLGVSAVDIEAGITWP